MNYKAEAEKIVEMFRPFADTNIIDDMRIDREMETKNAIQCAIKHVEGIMEETDSLVTMDKYTKILNQLKQML